METRICKVCAADLCLLGGGSSLAGYTREAERFGGECDLITHAVSTRVQAARGGGSDKSCVSARRLATLNAHEAPHDHQAVYDGSIIDLPP